MSWSSFVAAAAAVGVSPGLLMLAAMGVSAHYLWLTLSEQDTEAKLEQLEDECYNLNDLLHELSGNAQEIVGVLTESLRECC